MRVVERNPKLFLPRARIERIVLAEVAREQQAASMIDEESLSDEATAPLDVVTRDRVSRALEHVFTLLAVLLGSEAVKICFRALHQDDDRHRGTALEYLQTVLPGELRDAIWPSLGETGPLPSVRDPAEVLADLSRAMQAYDGSDVPLSQRVPLSEEAARSLRGPALSQPPSSVSKDG
jgi:hypothetical protein